MAVNFEKTCDPGQGLNFKLDEHATFGYITGLSIGDTQLTPNFKVVDPLNVPAPPKGSAKVGEGSEANTTGIHTKLVVAVLEKVAWNTEPTGNIDFEGRITPANMQLIYNLTMQSLSKMVVQIGFVVFEYDYVNNIYYTAYATQEGVQPAGAKPGDPGTMGFGDNEKVKPIYGLLHKESGTLKLTTDHTPKDDPPGFRNHPFTISVAATSAPGVQKIRVQTSNTNKMIKAWGLPTQ